MKKQILLFAGLLLATASQAQITLTESSYPAPSAIIGVDSTQKTTATSTFPTLTAATSATWDMSTITDTPVVFYNYFVNADTSEAQFADSSYNSFSGQSYQGNVQVGLNSTGLIQYGVNVDSETFVTSGATIFIPIQHTVFSSPDIMLAFPATMSSSWTSNYQSDFNFNVTYVPVYSNTAGVVKSFITEQDTVVGWGEMRVPTLTGSPSAYFHVLQVQVTTMTVDSFLIGGVVPPSPVLTALNITEGDTTMTYEQRYYRAGDVTPFARVEYANNTFSTPTSATTDGERLVDNAVANVVNATGVNIYPNPVTANVISIDLPALSGAWTYELTDISGRSIAAGVLTTNGTHAQLSLPTAAAPGIYNIRRTITANRSV